MNLYTFTVMYRTCSLCFVQRIINCHWDVILVVKLNGALLSFFIMVLKENVISYSTIFLMFLYCELRLLSGIAKRLWAGFSQIYGSIPGKGKRFFSSTKCLDQLFCSPDILSSWYSGPFTLEENSMAMKLSAVTTGANVKNRWNTMTSPCLHGVHRNNCIYGYCISIT